MTEKLSVTVNEEADPSKAPENMVELETGSKNLQRVVVDTSKPAPITEEKKGEELIFGKYKTMDEAQKAFKELESKIGSPAKKDEAKATAALKIDTATVDTRAAMEKAGLDFDALTTEFAETQALSEASYQKLEAAGYPKAKVDEYMQGQRALADQYRASVTKSVGGEEKLQSLLQWASTNLSEDEKSAANAALASGNAAQASLMLQGLNARFTAAVGTDPELVTGQNAGVGRDEAPFSSMDEMVRAMQDPRYGPDEAYTQKLYRRAAKVSGVKATAY
jgi:hypothetical protein